MLEAWGWRVSWAVYAGVQLVVCWPLHRFFIPDWTGQPRPGAPEPAPSSAFGDRRLPWLAASFAIATFIVGVIAVHLIPMLTSAGLTTAQAVSVAMLMGPMQVAGRIVELGIARHVRAVTIGAAAFVLMLLALVAMVNVDGFGIAAIAFVVVYGWGNGLLTIVRGTVPAEVFGARGLGGLLGYLSRPAFFARAMAPAAFSAVLTLGLTRNGALTLMIALITFALASYVVAVRGSGSPPTTTPPR
jgi:hypothetical protein